MSIKSLMRKLKLQSVFFDAYARLPMMTSISKLIAVPVSSVHADSTGVFTLLLAV